MSFHNGSYYNYTNFSLGRKFQPGSFSEFLSNNFRIGTAGFKFFDGKYSPMGDQNHCIPNNSPYQVNIKSKNVSVVNYGQLRSQDVNLYVKLKGHSTEQNVNRFAPLKNNSGSTQIQISNLKQLSPGGRIIQNRFFSTVRKLTNDELSRCENNDMIQKFLQRTHTIADLTDNIVGEEIKLCGWMDEDIRQNRFLTFRDGFGCVQLIIPNGKEDEFTEIIKTVDLKKSVIEVTGILRLGIHPSPHAKTGSVEIVLKTLNILNSAQCSSSILSKDEILNKPRSQNHAAINTGLGNDSIVEDFNKKVSSMEHVNEYTTRSHTCGELRLSDVGKEVKLCGWVEFIRMDKFILLRDSYGTTQIIIHSLDQKDAILANLHLESVICVTGVVYARPPFQIAKHLTTGEIEISAASIQVMNTALAMLPFHIRNYNKANEVTLNRYRFLALRYHDFQNNLRLRSEMLFKMREFLIKKKQFVEVETPTLFKKTPGGAQEFVVPTHFKDRFYALVQSPQQLKQLLMVGSLDRYFQIARCYRDERSSSERQPEFTQLDIELSFTDVDSIIKLTEDVLTASWPKNKNPPVTPFPRINYKYAIENYGSDKPCFIDKFLIQNIEMCIEGDNSKATYVYTVPEGKPYYNKLRSKFDLLTKESDIKVYVIKVPTVEKFYQDISKILPGFQTSNFEHLISLKTDDLLVLAVGSQKSKTLKMLGLCRHQTIEALNLIQELNEKGIYQFFWVVDFPLFEENEKGDVISTHHPFTQPYPEDVGLIPSDAMKARSLAYDLVLNGSEIGGGSIRIHNFQLQEMIFKLLGLSEENFTHLLEALQMGCPPHGGIALGIDRLIAIICNRNSIRDVIAFPKGTDGQDLMTNCPSDIPLADKIRYHLHTPDYENANLSPYRKSENEL